VIVDPSALFRAGLMHILAGTRFRIVADCSSLAELPLNALNGDQCLALISLDKNACAVLPQVSALKAQHESLRVVMFSDQLDPENFLAAIEIGGNGYLFKNEISPDALLKSLELILLGEVVVPHGFIQRVRGCGPLQLEPASNGNRAEGGWEYAPAQLPPQTDNVGRLSNREQTILWQLTQGASNKHIARDLEIAEATVKVHVKSLLRKIRVRNRTQAAMWAINHRAPTLDRQSQSGFSEKGGG